jgi:hypothetical protein
MSAKRIIRQMIGYGKKAKAPFPTKEAFVFLCFFIFSTLLWLLNKVSHVQELKMKVPVEFVGIPANVDITGGLPSAFIVKFKDKGTAAFAYIFRNELPPLRINLAGRFNGSGRVVIATSVFESIVGKTLKPTATQIRILPDSVVLTYATLYHKIVPVRFDGSFKTARQHIITNGIALSPASVEVYGPKGILDTLSSVSTEWIELQNIKDSVDVTCNIAPQKGLHFIPSKVAVHAAVELFTEKTLEVAVNSINVPENYLLRTFPARVKVICLVGVSHFNSLKAEDIQAVVDYNLLNRNNADKAKVAVFSSSKALIHYHLSPDMVDVLLEQKK